MSTDRLNYDDRPIRIRQLTMPEQWRVIDAFRGTLGDDFQSPVASGRREQPNAYAIGLISSTETGSADMCMFVLTEQEEQPNEALDVMWATYSAWQNEFTFKRYPLLDITAMGVRTKVKKERSNDISATTRLEEIVQSDAEQLWVNIKTSLEDEPLLDNVKGEFEAFLARHGHSGLRSLGGFMLNRLPSGDTSWTILRMLGESRDTKTTDARREVLLAALESRDSGLRYAAASALSELTDSRVADSLRQRLTWEKNLSVRHMIEAALRK